MQPSTPAALYAVHYRPPGSPSVAAFSAHPLLPHHSSLNNQAGLTGLSHQSMYHIAHGTALGRAPFLETTRDASRPVNHALSAPRSHYPSDAPWLRTPIVAAVQPPGLPFAAPTPTPSPSHSAPPVAFDRCFIVKREAAGGFNTDLATAPPHLQGYQPQHPSFVRPQHPLPTLPTLPTLPLQAPHASPQTPTPTRFLPKASPQPPTTTHPPAVPHRPRRFAKCPHHRRRTQCVDCYELGQGGGSLCVHRRRKDVCKACRAAGVAFPANAAAAEEEWKKKKKRIRGPRSFVARPPPPPDGVVPRRRRRRVVVEVDETWEGASSVTVSTPGETGDSRRLPSTSVPPPLSASSSASSSSSCAGRGGNPFSIEVLLAPTTTISSPRKSEGQAGAPPDSTLCTPRLETPSSYGGDETDSCDGSPTPALDDYDDDDDDDGDVL
ncbi:hypothetical protein DFJ73DRAFT_782665 [Zopfochytrium polystomum]|nr:hypothetical protein DFJ73DRAFT_782665 [Zopfochytrium polystomum]